MPAALLSLVLLAHLGSSSKASGEIISTTLGIALILTAATLIFRKALLTRLSRLMDGASEQTIGVLTVVLGAVLGVLVSISSVGAGAIGATVLLTLYPKSPIVRIVGSDIAHAVPLTLIAGAGHWWLGTVNFHMLVSLLVGSIPGIMISSHFASRVPDRFCAPSSPAPLQSLAAASPSKRAGAAGSVSHKPALGLFARVPSECLRGHRNPSGEGDGGRRRSAGD